MKRNIVILLILLLSAAVCHSQEDTTVLREKLYVHTDKDFYVTGEILWFKLYAVDACFNRPLDFSKLAYVEILSKDHKPILQAKIAMADAVGDGSFQLPYSISSGNYLLRAYTNWMRNAGTASFFEKTVTIVNTLRKPEWPADAAAAIAYDAQFLPEGGDLVAGMKSVVGFRITDKQGRGVDAKGAVRNSRNETVADFTTGHAGMGHFEMTAAANEQYTAVVTVAGKTLRKTLPPVKQNGMVMRLTDAGNWRLRVSVQSNLPGNKLSLLVQTRGITRLTVSKELAGGKTEIEIDKRQLGEGVSRLTILDAAGRAVCERLFFQTPREVPLLVRTDAPQYGNRKKITLDLPLNSIGEGNFSMAVYQLDELQAAQTDDIRSSLWLQSELNGFVENASYYFSSAPDAAQAADDLMLTQGWRRIRWERSAAGPAFLPEIEGHLVNGKVTDKRSGRAVENAVVFLSVPAEKPLFTTTTSGKDGNIRFNLKNFYGGNDIIVQSARADSLLRVDIATPFDDRFSETLLPGFILHESGSEQLTQHSIQAQVNNTYYSDKQQRFLFPSAIDTMPFYGVPDRRYYLDDYTRFITMEEVMREFVSDVRVRKNEDHFTYRVRNTDFNTFFETDPLVLFDGVPVFDADKLIAFDPLKVKRVDVVSHKFYQQKQVHDGIISYTTYQGDLAGFPLDAGALIVEYPGMQLQRDFYSPVYETAEQQNSRMPDLRNLLYWSPDIKPGTQTSFYSGDTEGRFLVVVQGITKDGRPGMATTTFVVAK